MSATGRRSGGEWEGRAEMALCHLELGVISDHVLFMAQFKTKPSNMTVRNSRTGQFVTVQGAGALRGQALSLKPGLDLTKPIAQQALKDIHKPKAE